MAAKRKPKIRNEVHLEARSSDGHLVDTAVLTCDDYYDGGSHLIDDPAYRARLGVATVKGEIYDPDGRLDQTFDNRYSDSGEYVGGRTVHADGTVVED